MVTAKSLISWEELTKALGKEVGSDIPEGWLTRDQWCEEWDVNARTAQRRIAEAVKAGVMSCRKFELRGIVGQRYMCPHYRVK